MNIKNYKGTKYVSVVRKVGLYCMKHVEYIYIYSTLDLHVIYVHQLFVHIHTQFSIFNTHSSTHSSLVYTYIYIYLFTFSSK